ncbi:MAG: sensor histidine kinase [Alphaproteobacteria bacterium]|nr:MAG: sensor histidine kinase [Alphaproteobacteria bacterium]
MIGLMYPYPKKATIIRDFIFMFLIIFVVLVFVGCAVAYKTHDYYAHETVNSLKEEHHRIDRTFHTETNFASYVLESLARQLVHDDYTHNPQKMATLLGSFHAGGKDNPFYELMWVNADLNVINTSKYGVLDVPYTVADRDHIKKALTAPWRAHIGRPIQGMQGEQWFLPISLGITDIQGTFIGVLTVTFDIQELTHKMQSSIQKNGVNFAMYTNTLTFVTDSAQSDDSIVPLNEDILAKFYKAAEQSSDSEILSMPSIMRRNLSFALYQKSQYYPYLFCITYDHQYFNDEIISLLKARMMQILVLAGFLFILLWLIRTRLIYPIEHLSEVAKNIISGKSPSYMPRGGSLEIEQLGNHISKLSACIEEQKRVSHELKLKNQYLGRTKETVELLTRARSDFLYTTMHDIQKPLARVHQSILEMLDYEHRTPAYVEQVNEISVGVYHLNQMLEDIKFIARTEYNSLILRETVVHVNFALHRAVRQFHEIPAFRHVNVKIHSDEFMPSVLVDEDRFLHMLVNILCGAASHIVQGTSIEISAHIEFNKQISKELVIEIKYDAHHLLSTQDFGASKPADLSASRAALPVITSRVVHETICFALARMLASLYQGEVAIASSKNDMHKIFLRFSKNILIEAMDNIPLADEDA